MALHTYESVVRDLRMITIEQLFIKFCTIGYYITYQDMISLL